MQARTRKLDTSGRQVPGESFLERHRASLVVLAGGAVGSEVSLERSPLCLGRGPDVDVVVDDAAVSRQHAVLELGHAGFRIRDLGSTNGVLVNGERVRAAELKHGDRFELGSHVFQYVIEERSRSPRVHTLPENG